MPLNLCKACGKQEEKMIMQIVTGQCWNCRRPMKSALISLPRFFGPEKFSDSQIKLAQSKNVVIQKRPSKAICKTYFANICPNCDSLTGQFFTYDNYIHGDFEIDNAENIDLGYYCTACDPEKYFDLD
jgi:hypothetical protein